MVCTIKRVEMLQPGQLLRTKYLLKDNKSGTVFGKYPHEAIVSYVPATTTLSSGSAGSILDDIKVIHFTTAGLEGKKVDEKVVMETSLRHFLVDSISDDTEVESKGSPYPAHEIIHTAVSLVGENGYILRKRNCQSFARHCYFGQADSPDVRLIAGSVVAAGLLIGGAILWVGETSSRTPFM